MCRALANCHAYMLDAPCGALCRPALSRARPAWSPRSVSRSSTGGSGTGRRGSRARRVQGGVDAGHDVLAGQPPIVRTDPIGSRPSSRPAEAPLDGFPGVLGSNLRAVAGLPVGTDGHLPGIGVDVRAVELVASTVFANASASTFLGSSSSAAAGPDRDRRRHGASTRPRSVTSSRWPFSSLLPV